MLFPYPAACTRKVFVCIRHRSHHAELVLYLSRMERADGPGSGRSIGLVWAEGCARNWGFRVLLDLKVCV